MAVATHDRAVVLFDEKGEIKDRFGTKPVDAKVILILLVVHLLLVELFF